MSRANRWPHNWSAASATLCLAAILLGSLAGCTPWGKNHRRGGWRSWFSNEPDPPRTVNEFLDLPRLDP